MPKAIRIEATGGPGVMRLVEVPLGSPGKGEALVEHEAIGLNFIDVYHRSGLYPLPLPAGLGQEGAGRVREVGEGVTDIAAGDRVAYAGGPPGAYAEARLVPADRLVKLPDAIDTRTAAAMMLKGMTAEYLLRRTFPVRAGHTVLVHAAAGGVGLIACQWAAHLGATVIGTVSTDEKANLAAAHGCAHPIVVTREDFVARVSEITRGARCDVVYDGIGRDTFMKSLDCLKPRGTMVSFGQSSGKIPDFDVGVLGAKGSLFLTRPSLHVYNAARADLLESARALFDVVTRGVVKIEIRATWSLADASRAHEALEGRRTTGASLLLP